MAIDVTFGGLIICCALGGWGVAVDGVVRGYGGFDRGSLFRVGFVLIALRRMQT